MKSTDKVKAEVEGLLRNPLRVGPLLTTLLRQGISTSGRQASPHLYAESRADTIASLELVMQWQERARRTDGGIAAYYSLATGYAPSYPETTGYLVPTFFDYAHLTGAQRFTEYAADMVAWLLSLQLPNGAYPGGLATDPPIPSVFNTGQILQGLVHYARETSDEDVLHSARRAGDWLLSVQHPEGYWEGPTYQGRSHTYYTMVSWSLGLLGSHTNDQRYHDGARSNLDWALRNQQEDGWFGGINLSDRPIYLHFVAYLLQGLLETGRLVNHPGAIAGARTGAWRLLRMFEIRKHLPGALREGWASDAKYACLTGNAQMSCVWHRLYEMEGDLRWLNAGLKINEMLKEQLPVGGGAGVRGGVAGSYPIWGRYQPLRYINWGGKFLADALMAELRLTSNIV